VEFSFAELEVNVIVKYYDYNHH